MALVARLVPARPGPGTPYDGLWIVDHDLEVWEGDPCSTPALPAAPLNEGA
jgi:hypothetical protein